METNFSSSDYLRAAGQVKSRLARLHLASRIARSHLLVAILVLATTVYLRFFAEWRDSESFVAGGMVILWILGVVVSVLFGLPGVREALLLLDRKGGWKDCYSSAWEFLQLRAPTEAQKLHLERAQNSLPDAVRAFPSVLPLPSLKWAWVAPLAAILFAFTPWLRVPPDSRDLELTDGMKDAAALQAEELRREAGRVGDPGSLTEDEKKELEALGVEVASMAEALANPDGLTAGEMLESLEGRAHAAERLADKLGLFSDAWASAAMLEEMSQHPDTADLSLLIKDKAAAAAAVEAMRLRDVLNDEAIKIETGERVTHSLERIMQAATEDDRTKPVGERFGNASLKMLSSQPKPAAREFEELAKHFREIAGREEVAKKLDDLAQTLREAGGEISGSELEKMERIADAADTGQSALPEGLQALESEPPGGSPVGMPGTGTAPNGQKGAEAIPMATAETGKPGGEQKAPVPGAAAGKGEKSEGAKKGEQTFSAPVPGEKSPEGKSGSGMGMTDKARDGEGKGGMLSAPVPGMESGKSAPGAGASLSAGASSQSGQGGDQAGTGTAELVDQATEALKASGDAKVVAQSGQNGDSTVRSIEGEARAEKAARTRQEVIADFISVEEQALDDQSLPLSRRQHVLRYFSAIRQQFEKAGKE